MNVRFFFFSGEKRGLNAMVGGKKGQRRGYGNRSIPQSAHQVLDERGETRQSEVSRAKSI